MDTKLSPSRVVYLNHPERNRLFGYPTNKTKTHKYTVWNFIPRNLWEQFRRLANFYFLLVAIVQSSPVSPLTPVTSIFPLVLVISLTAVKDLYEDIRRRREDQEANRKPVSVLREDEFVTTTCESLVVGDIVKVCDSEDIPADIVPLWSSNQGGICSVETSNLDGESTRKVKLCVPATCYIQSASELTKLEAKIEYEEPNPHLEQFCGKFVSLNPEVVHSLDEKNLLLRGSSLKNTDAIYGIVLYTGPDTKLALNQKGAPSKFSHVERRLNRYVVWIFISMIILCLMAAGMSYAWTGGNGAWYLQLPRSLASQLAQVAFNTLTFFVLLNFFIPISLYVSIELCKVCMAAFIQNDLQLYDEQRNTRVTVKTVNLLEELGQVSHIFTDKTGTLTENQMIFRNCSIHGRKYYATRTSNDPSHILKTVSPDEENLGAENVLQRQEVQQFLLALALTNTIYVEHDENGDEVYQSSSPDEEALVKAARAYGVRLKERSFEHITVEVNGNVETYEILSVIEFSPERRRMSVVVRTPKGDIVLYIKGADNVIYQRLSEHQDQTVLLSTREHLNYYSSKGFRVLCVGYRYLEQREYEEWHHLYNVAQATLRHRTRKIEETANIIERKLVLLGATVIEDKLQDGVPETLRDMQRANIKLWVLTGDKVETAIAIGKSCNLIQNRTRILRAISTFQMNSDILLQQQQQLSGHIQINEKVERPIDEDLSVMDILNGFLDTLRYLPPEEHTALVIDGDSLRHALDECPTTLLDVALKCSTVFCCRVSPIQKADVVKLVKAEVRNAVTLAIGDGGNDVAMIQEADVGVGLMGREGSQASRASDFAVSRFRFLKKLLLVHGRYSYIRITKLVQYFFFKNIAFTLPQFYFLFFNGFSGESLYDSWLITFYNLFFTSLPIFAFAIFNKDLDESFLLRFPELFSRSQQNKDFNYKTFLLWMADAVWVSCVFFFGTMYLFGDGVLRQNGQVYGLFSMGLIALCICNSSVTLRIAFETNYWTWVNQLAFWLTFIGVPLVLFPYCLIPQEPNNMWFLMFENFMAPRTWLIYGVLVVAALLPYFTFKWCRIYLFPQDWHIIREIQLRPSRKHSAALSLEKEPILQSSESPRDETDITNNETT
jgi:phospholipid-translocating P-type ATPase (flippase)